MRRLFITKLSKDELEVIKKFEGIIEEDKKEQIIQEHLFDHFWLFDPSWERVEGTEFKEKTVKKALEVGNLLRPINARVVYYGELIENAYKSYSEYLDAEKKHQRLVEMFKKLELE